MNQRHGYLVLICCLLFLSFEQGKNLKTIEITVKAPFAMPSIRVPDFSKCPRLSIVEFGAVTGDKEKTSKAIAIAIDKASQIGGGVVVIPEGEWLTAKVQLKSNVNLHLDRGAVLLFSEDPNDYLPAVHSTWEGMECYNYSPLVYAYQCKNIAITGQGELKAKMDVWKQWFPRPRAHMESALVPTYEKRLTPIKDVFLTNVKASDVQFVSRIFGQKDLPVENVSLKNITTGTVREKKHIHENVLKFRSED